MNNLKRKYSVLGGVVAPKRSAYTMMGMRNPLAERPVKAIDNTLPSLRDNGGVCRFNDFNPYNSAPKKNPELVRNQIAMRSRKSPVKYTMNVNTFQPMGTPILSRQGSGACNCGKPSCNGMKTLSSCVKCCKAPRK